MIEKVIIGFGILIALVQIASVVSVIFLLYMLITDPGSVGSAIGGWVDAIVNGFKGDS